MKDFIAMKIGDSFYELLYDAFYFRECIFYFLFEESCEIVVHVFEDEEGRAPEEVAFVGFGDDDFL